MHQGTVEGQCDDCIGVLEAQCDDCSISRVLQTDDCSATLRQEGDFEAAAAENQTIRCEQGFQYILPVSTFCDIFES